MSKRKCRKNKQSSGSISERRSSFQFDEENKVPEEDRDEVGSGGEELLGRRGSYMDHNEVTFTQDSSTEESENVL